MKNLANLLLLVCLAFAPAARGSWTSPTATGSATGIGNPSCAQVSAGVVACGALSGQAALSGHVFRGSSWGTWTSLAGAVASNPSCTSDGTGKVLCAATAAVGSL